METNRREAEMRRRREEQRRTAKRRSQQKTEQKKKNHSFVLITMLCLLLAGGFIAAAFTVLFPVNTIVVEGASRYDVQVIKQASQIQEGQNLLRLSPAETEDNIRRLCPYIGDVVLKRKLPSRVVIQVKEATEFLAFPTKGGYLLSTTALETVEQVKEASQGMIVYGVSVTASAGGQPLVFANSDQEELLRQLVAVLQKHKITEITKIDLTDPKAIRLQYGDLHIWELGDDTNLEYKITFGYQISQKENGSGIIDLSGLSTGKNGYFKSEVLGDFMPQEAVDTTPTDVETVTKTDVSG
ncbi:MAG: FtsQ-type POTRA domain-containing protein [Clostridia bacterium]|nr:FtsQ-type POTRA domain-containing protein [Clostridia bacterium]